MGCYKDEVNNKYGKLAVLQYAGMGNGLNPKALWLCRCDCGKETTVRGDHLRGGGTLSCGCLCTTGRPCGDPDYPNAAFNKVLYGYVRRARERGYVWDLTKQEVVTLMSLPCHYCDIVPSTLRTARKWTYVYNGIDRVNNELGYISTNVVPCCQQCNMMKGTMKYDEFLDWIQRIAIYHSVPSMKEQM